jgi:hypothetical protein
LVGNGDTKVFEVLHPPRTYNVCPFEDPYRKSCPLTSFPFPVSIAHHGLGNQDSMCKTHRLRAAFVAHRFLGGRGIRHRNGRACWAGHL